jgi:SAM-dependent methyltransferase
VGHGFGHETASGITDKPSTKRKKALVPACGRGYDAVLLAYVFGYDVYALDISEEALVQANAYLANLKEAFSGLSQGPEDFPFWVSNRIDYPGHITYVLGDFFSDQWMKEEKIEDYGFDLIFDYTVSLLDIYPRNTMARRCADQNQVLLRHPTHSTTKVGSTNAATPCAPGRKACVPRISDRQASERGRPPLQRGVLVLSATPHPPRK